MPRRVAGFLVLFSFLAVVPPGVTGDDLAARRSALGVLPPPDGRTPATIDHEKPEQYAKIPKSAGTEKLIRKLARPLKADDPEQTLRRIHAFVSDRILNVPDPGWPPDPEDFDRLVRGFDHDGCASHALVFANLARACGIPCVYVKSNRHEWIREYVKSGKTDGFSGHVFLEVHLGGKWKLLDAQGFRIWDDYDPADPELPGGLLAYEKGWDHLAMVHSTRRDRYKAEARARWKGFDVSKLRKNEAPDRPLRTAAYAITLGDEWNIIHERVATRMCFDRYHWPEYREKVRGNVLIVTAIGGRTDLPADEAADWLPVSPADLAKEAAEGKTGVHGKRLADGTGVLLLSAPGLNELKSLLWKEDLNVLVCELGEK